MFILSSSDFRGCFGFFLFAFLAWTASVTAVEPAKPFERLDGCRLVQNAFNDGDSFHVRHEGKEFIFRLYFVDTPESQSLYTQRSNDQAAYFGLNRKDAVELGKKAAVFTANQLAGTFTVYTRWRDALGRSKLPRHYAVVMIGKNDLAELLVKNGLARIYGTRTPLPDGRDSRAYLARLSRLEETAKATSLGGWN
jgi:endonuclease YncB( thermonuclease family)